VELREYVKACRRRWPWLVLPVLLAAGIAAGLTLAAAPAYRSTTVLFVTTGAGDPDAKASRLNSYIALLTGPRVADAVAADLGAPLTADEVQAKVTAQVQDGTDLLAVTATDPSAERSRQIVTAATEALIGLAKQLDPPAAAGDGPQPSVRVAQDPVTTREASTLGRNVSFAAVLGLLIGAAAVALRQATGRTIAEEDDLRRLGLDTVGTIAIGRNAGAAGEAIAEAFRRLRSLLPDIAQPATAAGGDAASGDAAGGRSLLLTASQPKEGTTAVACGLAIAMAESGSRVVLVDANLRSPGVGRYLAMDTTPGLADVLAGSAEVPDVLQDSLDGRLTVLPCGDRATDPGRLLASPRLPATLAALTATFDIVIVDAPPLHGVADTVVLSKLTDGTLLVTRAGRTRAADVQRSTDLLARVGARLAGAVLNALPRKLPTGTSWHRAPEVAPPAEGLGLVTERVVGGTLYPEAPTVRGRARVVPSTLGEADNEPDHLPAQRDDD
jgi:capsular exopolysaccharide synthesis family protein